MDVPPERPFKEMVLVHQQGSYLSITKEGNPEQEFGNKYALLSGCQESDNADSCRDAPVGRLCLAIPTLPSVRLN